MNNAAGTIQNLLLQLADLLEPLRRELAQGRARATLAELGLVVTAAQETALANSLQSVAGNASDLVERARALLAALDAENIGETVTESAKLIEKIGGVIDGIDALKGAIGALGGVPPATVDAIPERLLNFLLVRASAKAKGVNEMLEFAGVLQREQQNAGSTDPDNPPYTISTFNFGRITDWIRSPEQVLQSLYQWGAPNFDGDLALRKLEALLQRLDAPAFYDDATTPPRLDILLVEIKPRLDVDPKGLSIVIRQSLNPGVITFEAADLKFEIETGFTLPFGTELMLQPEGKFTLSPPDPAVSISGLLELRVSADRTQAAEPYFILGEPGGSRLEVRKFSAFAGGQFSASGGKTIADLSIGGAIDGGRLLISTEESDGFLSKLLPASGLQSDFNFGFGYSSKTGLFFTGSAGLEIQLPLHLSLGPVEINALSFSVGVQDKKFPTAIAANLKASLGPIVAVVEGVGLRIDVTFKDDRQGNLGPLDFAFGFKPPNGVGLAIDAGVVKGGGYLYFDSQKEQYAGALELVFKEFLNLKAIGVITTRMPDGSSGFSLLIIITADFGAGIQLGLGFNLLAVGGLIGLNRSLRLQPLVDAVRTGAISSVLFPQDVIANAPRIISDLNAFFPPQEGRFLIGPMAKIGWGSPTLVSLSLGVIFEIPGNIALVGTLRAALPKADAPILLLQANFVGAIEFDKQRIWFFASLFDSRVLSITLDGEMGVLAAFGDDPDLVLSVGGFHPGFDPPPLPFPVPKRISINLANTNTAKIRAEGYFALTSNTAQFGARAELTLGFSHFGIQGHVSFDALFQFSPFYFIIDVSASVSLKAFGVGVFSIRLRFSLEGPTPWRARGEGSISFFFFSISADFDISWGETRNTSLPPIPILPILKAEFDKVENWRALPPAANNLLVSLRKLDPAPGVLALHPLGVLQVSQKAIPLDLDLDRVGGQKPSDARRFNLKVVGGDLVRTEDKTELFAPAQFQDLDDAAKLSRPAFEPFNGGLELGAAGQQLASGKAVKRIIRYEEIIIDNNFKRFVQRHRVLPGLLFAHFLNGNAITKTTLSKSYKTKLQPFAEKIRITPDRYTVALSQDNRAFSDSAAEFNSEATAREYLNQQVAFDPTLADALHVIPFSEVNRTQVEG